MKAITLAKEELHENILDRHPGLNGSEIVLVDGDFARQSIPYVAWNVWSLTPDGDVEWTVKGLPSGLPHDHFVSLYDHEGELRVATWGGHHYRLNKTDGSVEHLFFGK